MGRVRELKEQDWMFIKGQFIKDQFIKDFESHTKSLVLIHRAIISHSLKYLKQE